MDAFKGVAPLSLAYVQTDNGSEFADHFEIYCDKENIVHFMPIPERQRCKVKLSVSIALFQKRLFQETGIYSLMILRHSTKETYRLALMVQHEEAALVDWTYFSFAIYYE